LKDSSGTIAEPVVRPSSGVFYPEIDGMRAFAAFNVLACHALLGTKWAPLWLIALQDGALGVEFFFVLSGFLLFVPFAKARIEGTPWPSLKGYAIRRVLRILPAYYVAVVLILLFQRSEAFTSVKGLWTILGHATMTFTFSTETMKAFNPVFWTLAVEEQFYFLLPFAALLFCRRGGRWIVLATVPASHFLIYALDRWWPGHHYLLTATLPFRWDGFAFGIFICLSYFQGGRERVGEGAKGWLRAAAGIGGFVFSFLVVVLGQFRLLNDDQLQVGLMALGFAVLLWATLAGPTWLGGPWRWKPVRYLGLLTYSVYLWHWQVAEQVRHLTAAPTGPGSTVVRIATVFVFTVLIATVSYWLVERPFMQLRKRFKS
jgi:peptidoglycan/LPS O-acetylase OafA/YrhL